jgi:uncharacterized protein YecE (DUF72 family)
MNKRQVISSLSNIAEELDNNGLYIEAEQVINVMRKIAQVQNEAPPQNEDELFRQTNDMQIEFMQKVWEFEKMHGEIIAITPSLRTSGIHIPRGMEINYYLENDLKFRHINWSKEEQLKYMKESDLENYIIIDDDGDMLYGQRNHFVHVLPSPRNKDGFNQKYYEEALEKLSKTIIDLNY